MAKGLYLGVGLNMVDPNRYGGWDGRLRACEYDIHDMSKIATKYGFGVKQLLTKDATRDNVKAWIRRASDILKPEDIFILNYSGHGGQMPDRNGDEDDGQDETWCLYDGQLIDDELFSLLHTFPLGTRIIVISDSCHSGTVIKDAHRPSGVTSLRDFTPEQYVIKSMPIRFQEAAFMAMKDEYETVFTKRAVLKFFIDQRRSENYHPIMLISGCQDNQYSQDGLKNGLFTGTLKEVWNDGEFKGSYKEFYTKILRRMPPSQTPNMMLIGDTNNTFINQTIFTIGEENDDKQLPENLCCGTSCDCRYV